MFPKCDQTLYRTVARDEFPVDSSWLMLTPNAEKMCWLLFDQASGLGWTELTTLQGTQMTTRVALGPL